MPNPIEELFIRVGLDFRQALTDAERGTGQLGQALNRIEQRFPRLARAGRAAFLALAVSLGVATAAVAALGAGLVASFQAAEEGIRSVRLRRAFRNLAAAAGETGDAILASMKKASAGTVQESELMRLANLGMQLNVATTAEEFGQLTEAAILLGEAMGTNAVTAIEELTVATGRQSKLILDNLGLSISEVNAEMDKFAQQEFGKTVKQLDAAQRSATFVAATLLVVDRNSDKLRQGMTNVGVATEQARVSWQEFGQDVNEASIIISDSVSKAGFAMSETFFGPNGVFPLFAEGGNIVAEVFARVIAGFFATAGTIAQGVNDVRKIFTGELALSEVLGDPSRFNRFSENFETSLNKLRTDFAEVFQTAPAPTQRDRSPLSGLVESADQDAELLKEFLLEAQSELLDLRADLAMEQEELSADHAENMLEIEQKFSERRQDLAEDLARRLADLEDETAERRAEIFRDARQALEDLERETDQALEREREDFQIEERRSTEDHLREMRQLRLSYLDDLQGAVAARDARRVVDLQRQFEREKAEREEDFNIRQGRDREDTDLRLAEIRQMEQERSAEIQRNLDNELIQLAENERKRRGEIQSSHQEQLIQLNDQHNATLQAEMEAFNERQQQLDQALSDRLVTIAREMADEQAITEEGASQVLSTLATFFGRGGEIDKLMEDFTTRRRQRMSIEIDFEGGSSPTSGGGGNGGSAVIHAPGTGPIPFQHGGTLLARKPTLAMFGEAGPELAQFTPLRNISPQSRRIQLDLNLSGSAPPGIRSADRDQIANILVQALREAGAMRD